MNCLAAPAPLVFLTDSVVDDKALVSPVGTAFAGPMNGTAFQNDILVYHNGWQYTAWYDTVGTDQNVLLARRSIRGPFTGAWEKFDTGSDQVNGDESAWDTHNTISLGISKADGVLHMSWDHHGNTLRYRRSITGLTTHADKVWNSSQIMAEQNWITNSGTSITSVTYPMFINTPENTLLFNYRTGGSNNGSNWLASWQSSTENYASPNLITIKDGTYSGLSNNGGSFTSTSRNAYANGFDFTSDGTLHYTWTWRESVVASNHDVCYAYSPDRGVKWYNNAGTLIADTSLGQRIRVDTPGTVVIPLDCRQQLINQQTQCVDEQGRVHILVYHRRQEPGFEWTLGDGPFSGSDTAYFHYFRNPATGAWSGSRLPVTYPVGSRPDVETLSNGDIYTVYRSGKELVIAAATAATNYTDWTVLTTTGTNFGGEPRLDHDRLRTGGVLSVFISEDAPASSTPTPVPLHVLDYATGSVFEAFAGQDQRVIDIDGNGTQSISLNGEVGSTSGMIVASQRWLYQGNVVATQATHSINLPVGTHTLTYEATSQEGVVSTDRIVIAVVAIAVKLPIISATASSHDGNLPVNTLDASTATRWSALGDGEFITWEFSNIARLRSIALAFYLGNARRATFDILTSLDGITWVPALSRSMSSGTSLELETFDITDIPARYIRYVGHGNTASMWNSLTEVTFDLAQPQPYLPDSETLHLWHLDEPAAPFANAAQATHSLKGQLNGALAQQTAPSGFGTAVNFNTGSTTNRGIVTYASTLSALVTPETPPTFAYHGPDGAFTIEAMVRFDIHPGTWTTPGQIVSMDGDGSFAEDRVFQFRIASSNGLPTLQFIKLAVATESLSVPLPAEGVHTPATNVWYHVAITYNGKVGEAENTRFYWTRLDSGVAIANQIGTATLSSEFTSATMQGDFSIGNEARSTGGSSEVFLGSIDEVRISSIARSPSAFVFSHDADQDQLTDAWEMTHFGHLAQRAEDDYDADGTSNLVESLLQLHPASGRSMFRAEMKRTGNNLSLNWQSAPGVRFRVERSTNLSGTWNDLGIMEGGTFTDANPPAGKAFYRIRLLRP
jgi:hypothetical protein